MRALVLSLIAANAFASVMPRPADLDEAARGAELAVIAERAGPAARASRWRIVEILRWRGDAAKAPSGIVSVFGAHQELDEMMAKHIREHGYQGLPEPILPFYKSSLDEPQFARSKRAILFLRRWKKDWQLTIDGAWEAVGKKEVVVRALERTAKENP